MDNYQSDMYVEAKSEAIEIVKKAQKDDPSIIYRLSWDVYE